MKRDRERAIEIALALCASVIILSIAAIFIFVGANAYQTFTVFHISLGDFLFGKVFDPGSGQVGSAVSIVGSLVVTVLAVLIATPLSVGVAIFVSQIAPPWARRIMQPVLELFTGIPSIIYGFLGVVILVPLIAAAYNYLAGAFLYNGFGIVAAAIVLTIMIFPTITTISIDALNALPDGLREASLALGATRWQTIRRTLLPAAKSGIYTGIILGMGRAVGETLAVAFVIGSNTSSFPLAFTNIYPYLQFFPTSTITVQLLYNFKEAAPGTLNYSVIWTLSFMLLLISFLLVAASRWVASRGAYNATERTGSRVGLRGVGSKLIATVARSPR